MAASEGVDLEWAIVEMSKIRMGKQRKVKKIYSAKIKKQAQECVEHLFKKIGDEFDIYHSDEKIPWIGKSIFAKPEPKTDIVIAKGNKKYYVSVKMAGGIQLASGQGASTAELFQAAADALTNTTQKKVLKSIIDELKTMPTKLLSEANLKRIMTEGDPKLIKEFIKDGKVIKDRSYEQWLKNNKPQLMAALLKFVDSSPEFFDALITEAMTGQKTLKDYKGAPANSIISPSGFYLIDANYVKKIRPKIKMDLRAKSRGGISSVAFRIETKGSV
jgi:rubrerythrin